jgi:ferritin-like metal-binding protein YciE
MNTFDDLFEHELEDIYYAEHQLLDVLEELAEQTEHEQASTAFREHREETERHVRRLEEVFEMIGEPPEEEECEGINGLIQEHDEFLEEDPSQDVLDHFNLGAAQKTEHYEIAAYGSLAHLANQLGMDEAAELLGENLDEEKAMLEHLKSLTEEYDREVLPA